VAENWIRVDGEGRLQEETYCIKCDNDLTGEKVSGLCPHCGSAVAVALAGEPVCNSDEDGKIAEHVSCRECHGDLYGIGVDGECEQCQTPSTHSLSAYLLRYADDNWLRTVRSGLLWYVIIAIVTVLIGAGSGLAPRFIHDRALISGISSGVGFVSAVLFFLAIWFVTTPAPSDENRTKSTLARFMGGMLIFGAFLNFATVIRPDLGMWPALPGILITIGFTFTFYSYLGQLAQRIPDEKLLHHVRIVLIGLVTAYSILFIGSLLMALSGVDPIAFQQAQVEAARTGQAASVSGSKPLFYSGSASSCLGLLPLLVFGVWSIILMFKLRNRLSACIRPEAMTV